MTGGDGDAFLDNCETANVTFTVENTGTGPLTNVRLVAVAFLTHPTSVLADHAPRAHRGHAGGVRERERRVLVRPAGRDPQPDDARSAST